jgi:hypothetical protein
VKSLAASCVKIFGTIKLKPYISLKIGVRQTFNLSVPPAVRVYWVLTKLWSCWSLHLVHPDVIPLERRYYPGARSVLKDPWRTHWWKQLDFGNVIQRYVLKRNLFVLSAAKPPWPYRSYPDIHARRRRAKRKGQSPLRRPCRWLNSAVCCCLSWKARK